MQAQTINQPVVLGSVLKDVLASVVVFLVALPLCMGIAIGSGMPPAAGIVTGVIGGLVVSSLGGCELQVSGPAAGLAVIIFELLHDHGLDNVGLVILIAGAIQLVAGLLGFAQVFRAVPPSVIHGMLSGIGVLIFASQFHVMVDDSPRSSGLANLASIPESVLKGIIPNPLHTHDMAALLGVATIIILLLWQYCLPKKLRVIPGALVAVAAVTAAAWFFHVTVRYVNLPANLLDALHMIVPNTFAQLGHPDVLLDGLAVAFIASAETLLTAAALDKMHSGQRTNFDRELAAQGVGNMLCGIAGVLPLTGVMVRSGANVGAGAKTRFSGILHGLWLLLFVCLAPGVLKMIPTSALAALLVFTGFKLINLKVLGELRKFGRSEVAIYVATLISVVSIDLLTGIVIGVVLTIGKLLYIFSHLEIKIADDPDTNCTHIWLKGTATFLSLPRFASALDNVRPDCELHLHLDALQYIDHTCLDLLMSWDGQHQARGGTVDIDWNTLGAVFGDRRRLGRPGTLTQELRMDLADRNEPAVQQQPSSDSGSDIPSSSDSH